MSDGFDLAVYIKGDRKPTALYNAKLVIAYEGETAATDFDAALADLSVPAEIDAERSTTLRVSVTNGGSLPLSGDLLLTGITERGYTVASFTDEITDLPGGGTTTLDFYWRAPDRDTTVNWTATVTADGDTNPSNDTAIASTVVDD